MGGLARRRLGAEFLAELTFFASLRQVQHHAQALRVATAPPLVA